MPKKSKKALSNEELFEMLKTFIDEEIRPYLQYDGGDIDIIEFTKDHVLRVKLQGACVDCFSSTATLEWGTQERIDLEFNEPLKLDPPIIIERIEPDII
ncbi:MAG: nitrogen-fixing NifU domain-containing protein [Candidatus Peregrinibacteria bacterium GW2011_GWF2_33_10]|nr:MAG: nitrogen-fixing NifU domain-containing protein [Candidatus Peregrinibacteria bacterium GW2011_GWF2_33_10]OGJ45426.1 MAG: hypothetical protein A2263_04130 [Candidatus Peregrinibacteria bacterium RIFOXYA2_FULL_33_21]OGJ45547.1 MAG: hypothetical protein A2272_01050 [Candidatus Peregrinibacteria bacterium RIFOXYA12_FULL_33_12]OGJ51029.1 MAG: hypothetical protein A2307_05725 [Candidatus Peregrinibacteria bacterium RIFOXYB2_FULL_33_20]